MSFFLFDLFKDDDDDDKDTRQNVQMTYRGIMRETGTFFDKDEIGKAMKDIGVDLVKLMEKSNL